MAFRKMWVGRPGPVHIEVPAPIMVPGDHPNALYAYSTAADAARREADVIIACATRVGNLDIPYDKYWGDPSAQELIQIDVDARNMGVTRRLALGILSDVKFALAALVRTLRSRTDLSRKPESSARYRAAMRE